MSEQVSGEELRRSPRRSAGWRCQLNSPGKGLLVGKVENASAEGLLLELEVTLPDKEVVLIKTEVNMGGRKWEFVVRAIVRHNVFRTHSCMVGVEISQISPKDAKFLHDYCYGII